MSLLSHHRGSWDAKAIPYQRFPSKVTWQQVLNTRLSTDRCSKSVPLLTRALKLMASLIFDFIKEREREITEMNDVSCHNK